MKYIATDEALNKLNTYKMTENEVLQEFKGRLKAETDGDIRDIVLNWKNKDLVILALGKKTAIIFEYGQELKCSYEDLPEIEYVDNKWKYKMVSES